jgi:hypothetical protein
VYAPYSFSEVMATCVVENEQRGNRCEATRPECFFVTFFYKKVTKEIARIKVHLLVG